MLPYIHLLSITGSAAASRPEESVTVAVLLARNVSYILILAILSLAVLYSWLALRQYRILAHHRRRVGAIARTKDAVDSYLAIATHQLNSPVSLMKSAVDLLEAHNAEKATEAKNLRVLVTQFDDAVAGLLVANRVSNAQTSRKDQYIATNLSSPFRSRMVWMPAVLALTVLLFINGLSLFPGILEKSVLGVVIEFGVLTVAISMMAFAYRYRSLLQQAIVDAKAQLVAATDSYTERTAFIGKAHATVDKHVTLLKQSGQSLADVAEAKPFFKGLKMASEANEGLARVERFVVRGTNPLFDLATFVRKTAAEAQALTANQHITFDVDITNGIAVRVQPEEIRYIVHSLIDNAVKFSNGDSHVAVQLTRRGNKILFTVEDQGAGISAQRLPTLLKPFAQGADPAQLSFASMGLSLYLVKIIVAKLGGELTIKSRLGEGTSVTVMLPYNAGLAKAKITAKQHSK